MGQGNQKNSKWIFMVNSQNQNKRPIREIVSGIILSRIHYYFFEYIYFWFFFFLFSSLLFCPYNLPVETMNISAIHVEIHNARCNHFIYLRLEIAKCVNVIRNGVVCRSVLVGFFSFLLVVSLWVQIGKRQKDKKIK